ncbi:hypothetical protein NL676_029837 [Syzygium grande]|nr:hypothetical protein NL676_029837 [Syzygium grande]
MSKTPSLSTPSCLNPFVFCLRHYVSKSLHYNASRRGSMFTDSAAFILAVSVAQASIRSLFVSSSSQEVSFAVSFDRSCSFRAFGRHGGSGGGDGNGVDNEDGKVKSVVDGTEEASVVSSDVIILDIGGMTCGECAASVK